MPNPLIDDRDVDFLLDEVLDLPRLLALPYFAEHDRETIALTLDACRRLAREALFPAYRALDAEPPRLVDGRIRVHPRLRELWPQMVSLGLVAAPRPHEVGGSQLPLTVFSLATAYLMAANLSAYGYLGLTQGAAHLLEAFGSDELRATYMARMYRGEWTGTMALTEPQAGSSLSDVQTSATPAGDHYLISGAKIFISGGDHDLADNVVHMTLARIRGAPPGIKGVSLFCVPRLRLESGALVDNDIATAQMIHKIGWRGLPSLALSYGERGDCRGWLVGEPHQGIRYMFQMMNEARIMVGLNGVATASVAYHESLAYARDRTQGRPITARDPASPPIAIIQHADVRRMLIRQKAIVEGGLYLVARTSFYADLATHSESEADRAHFSLLLDLLTPITKSFPAERGFESNALALQIHGGYGYSSEYLPESWLRDQKLNSIHEGTTGIHAIDLLGRRAVARNGAALAALIAEITATCTRARASSLSPSLISPLEDSLPLLAALTSELAQRGLRDLDAMLLHASDYLDLFSTIVVSWLWLDLATSASRGSSPFHTTKLLTAEYFLSTELPRIHHLAHLCRSAESSYARLDPTAL